MKDSPAASPPFTPQILSLRTHHGDTFSDPYEWLRDRNDPKVLEHLAAEQAHTEAVTAHQEPLRSAIFNEICARTPENDNSLPYRRGNWWYFSRLRPQQEHKIYCRAPAHNTGVVEDDWAPPQLHGQRPLQGEEVLFDSNTAAAGQPFFSLGSQTVDLQGKYYAYAADITGDERFTVRIRDLETGVLFPELLDDVGYDLAFSGSTLFYSVFDDQWRPYEVRAHRLGTPVEEDTVVFHEQDSSMWLSFELSADEELLVIDSGCSELNEIWVIDLQETPSTPRRVLPRSERVCYNVTPVRIGQERALIVTHNRRAPNFMVSLMPWHDLKNSTVVPERWQTVIRHSEQRRLVETTALKTHLMITLREHTTENVVLIPLDDLAAQPLYPMPQSALTTTRGEVADSNAPLIRLECSSFHLPHRTYDYFLNSQRLILRQQRQVLGTYDPTLYTSERFWIPAEENIQIPVSLIHRKDLPERSPVVVYGYGSYEESLDPHFSIPLLSLLDRGVIFAIAHVRGGGELGRSWYENGKRLQKHNSFDDFVTVTRWLAQLPTVDPQKIAAVGGSAGGLLVGAAVNKAPELYKAVLAQVPFVDPLTSILNPDLPLSALEWEEWGNPLTSPEVYWYMKGYAPYENIRPVDYPTIAAVTSLNDTRVLYVEPAKWVQALRTQTTGEQPILLKVDFHAGHAGASGRYAERQSRAWDYAFLLDALEAWERLPD